MKTILVLFTFLVAVSFVVSAPEKPANSKKLLHVVAFKFKPSTTPAQIQEVVVGFRALKTKIPQVQSFEWGTNLSPEKLDKGFTHGFLLSFKSEKDRDAYLVHPDHKAFAGSLGPVLEDAFVIDYWSQE
jgi:hypothetical protein